MPATIIDEPSGWYAEYQKAHPERFRDDPEFAAWLKNHYVPIAGGWQY
ncbi:MAG TPA: hypothetical protein VF069_07665 [Streptosporangiaceae bacterium]